MVGTSPVNTNTRIRHASLKRSNLSPPGRRHGAGVPGQIVDHGRQAVAELLLLGAHLPARRDHRGDVLALPGQ
ncbi:MAG: hypothetical protein HY906_21180, partial [Deltaproteobacteria bacterium]|nr:hypothetical protein [Deltaproteobacteria bacterium]